MVGSVMKETHPMVDTLISSSLVFLWCCCCVVLFFMGLFFQEANLPSQSSSTHILKQGMRTGLQYLRTLSASPPSLQHLPRSTRNTRSGASRSHPPPAPSQQGPSPSSPSQCQHRDSYRAADNSGASLPRS